MDIITKQYSSHNSETTLCSAKHNCLSNNSSHKRSKSNCFNSYGGVSTNTSNANTVHNNNHNNTMNVKTVVFNPNALKSKEQIINVSYRFDSRKQMLSQDGNCLKILINFMDINNGGHIN